MFLFLDAFLIDITSTLLVDQRHAMSCLTFGCPSFQRQAYDCQEIGTSREARGAFFESAVKEVTALQFKQEHSFGDIFEELKTLR